MIYDEMRELITNLKAKQDLTHEAHITNSAMGMMIGSSKAGEVVKRVYFRGKEFDRAKLVEEMGNICFYMFFMCSEINVSFEDVLQKCVNKHKE